MTLRLPGTEPPFGILSSSTWNHGGIRVHLERAPDLSVAAMQTSVAGTDPRARPAIVGSPQQTNAIQDVPLEALLVVVAAGENPDLVRQYLVDQSVFLVNASRPASRQLVFQWLGLPYAGEWISLRVAYEADDSNRLSSIPFRPLCQVFERSRIEFDASYKPSFATASSRGTPPWRSRAASKRCRMVSDFSRYAVSRSEAISLQSAIGTITAVGSPASLDTTWISASDTPSY